MFVFFINRMYICYVIKKQIKIMEELENIIEVSNLLNELSLKIPEGEE